MNLLKHQDIVIRWFNLSLNRERIKPSDALTAMIDGMWRRDADPNFVIDMRTFGREDSEGVCFGCAATCAVLELYPNEAVDFSDRRDRHKSLLEFENMIDDLRLGCFSSLGRYFRVDLPQVELPYLHSHDWKDGIGKYVEYRDLLLGAGL